MPTFNLPFKAVRAASSIIKEAWALVDSEGRHIACELTKDQAIYLSNLINSAPAAVDLDTRGQLMLCEDALREVLKNMRTLDCGHHHCRYCDARSPEWNHAVGCAYAHSVKAFALANSMANAYFDTAKQIAASLRGTP